jgi:hypothetical protein
MALENATYISSLNSSNPTSTDGLAQADDHIRLIKAVLQSTFPNINAAMTATDEVLNGLDARVTNLEALDPIPSGETMLFFEADAPTGWTRVTAHNDKALRVVGTSAGGATGGSVVFSSVFNSKTPSGSVAVSVTSHPLTKDQIPDHTHTYRYNTGHSNSSSAGYSAGYVLAASSNRQLRHSQSNSTSNDVVIGSPDLTSVPNGHTHPNSTGTFSGNVMDFDVEYCDVILATRDA